MMRGDDAMELLAARKDAYVLAMVIAHRARWKEGYNQHGLGVGEAFIGDPKKYGMTRQSERTARKYLERGGFATFRATNKGTIAKLTDTRLFDVSPAITNQQGNQPATNRQPATSQQPTTNEEGKTGKTGNTDSDCVHGAEALIAQEDADLILPPQNRSRDNKFRPPEIEEVKLQAVKIELSEAEAIKFYDYQMSSGWMVGTKPMRSWHHALNTWKHNAEKYGNSRKTSSSGSNRNRGQHTPVSDYSKIGFL
jgi:hypothetical protein